ncbi:MAG: groS [Alphaproteobacteria bacterium]|nr:groS [Alphaproteobacteria bacterium]
MSFRPLHDRVLVSRLEGRETTKGGIIIPDTAKEKPMEGTVVAVGTGYHGEDGTTRPLAVQTGDTVVFAKWSGTELTIDGKEYLVMKESDIMGILDTTTTAQQKAA